MFAGGAGIFGAIGDGFVAGHSLEVGGNGSGVRIEVTNPDAVPLQIERARSGTNLWAPLDATSTEGGVYETVWANGFIYRVRQTLDSTTGIVLFATNNLQINNNEGMGGFVTQQNNSALATLAQLQQLNSTLTTEIDLLKEQQNFLKTDW